MKPNRKTEQLQIRVSPAQKRSIQRHAAKARMSMSDWVLSRALPSPALEFQKILTELAGSDAPGYAFAELLELLEPLSRDDFERLVAEPPEVALDPYWANYVAATVEHAAARKGARAPLWTRDVPPLDAPHFGSSLRGLRLHLLVNSPAAFAARNLFIDATVGDRV